MQFALHDDVLRKLGQEVNDFCKSLQACIPLHGARKFDANKVKREADRIFREILSHPAVLLLQHLNVSDTACQRQELAAMQQEFQQIVSDVHKKFGHGMHLHTASEEKYRRALS